MGIPSSKYALEFELGLGLREIARSCSLGLGTVHDYLQRAKTAGITWPLPEGWGDEKLESPWSV